MDYIDKQILEILTQNSKLTNKEIGQRIHMTGQAVGKRITQLQDAGIIRRFSVDLYYEATQFIRVFMDTNDFQGFEQSVLSFQEVASLYKVSGQACYMIISHFTTAGLSEFIEKISKWARYSVETVVADKKVEKDFV